MKKWRRRQWDSGTPTCLASFANLLLGPTELQGLILGWDVGTFSGLCTIEEQRVLPTVGPWVEVDPAVDYATGLFPWQSANNPGETVRARIRANEDPDACFAVSNTVIVPA